MGWNEIGILLWPVFIYVVEVVLEILSSYSIAEGKFEGKDY
jgi:hypothetical protein